MARLQDFNPVTPTDSDNLLVVQATGQGLAPFGSTVGNKALKTDLASISITGSTNNTGSTIYAGTFFYLNGSLVIAKTDVVNGATLTSGTNYSTVTAGGLNRANFYDSGDVITLTNNGFNSVYESTTEIRLFILPQKRITKVSSFSLNITRLEVYCNGNDNEQLSYITSATAEKRGEQIFIKIQGSFVNSIQRSPIFLVISGTITMS